MYQILPLQRRLLLAKNIRSIANYSGVSEKTIYRIKMGESDTTLGTANRILAALDLLEPVKTRKPRTTAEA
jgi:hypothetical protein